MCALQIVFYPHPALRWKSKDITRIDPQLKEWANQMFELMYEARGIGLAANQVALPYRMFVINPTGDPEQSEHEQVFINPEILRRNGSEEAEEGCLSMPEIFGPVNRAERIVVEAFDIDGQQLRLELGGIEARVVQHETDHLDGVMFTERVASDTLSELQPQLNDLVAEFQNSQEKGLIDSDELLTRRLRQLETERSG
ncbi:MAG: peptide deformylase [Fuerstiella sp.]|nr:peptide deformylase [Fuerstiella sp.]